jgi:uncharacterized protein YdhG (YjbR/CyaY superfamily)
MSKGEIMDKQLNGITTIDQYIALFPEDVQVKLKELRKVIKAAAPEAGEKISYQMPTFTLFGNLVHFAAFNSHIGFYPAPSGIEQFKAEMEPYHTSKGTLRFPLDKPIPYDLISRIVTFRVSENLEKAKGKRKKNT